MGEWFIIGPLCMSVNTLVLYDNMYHIYTTVFIVHAWSIDLYGATHIRLFSWHEWHWCNGRNFVTTAENVLLFGICSQRVKRTADVMAPPRLSVVFRWLVRLCSFPACWRQVNVTPILKGLPSSSVDNYWPLSIASVLSKVFERLVSVRFGGFMKRSGVLPTTQCAYRKGLGICDALLCMPPTLQSALESGQEARIVQIDFSAAVAYNMHSH